MANTIKTGLKPDSVENMVFGAGVLYKNFSYGTHYKQTFDKTPQDGKRYYYLSGGPTGGVSYMEFTDEAFASGNIYFEQYEGYGGDKIGATKDGSKVSIVPEYTDIEIDGVLVKMEGLTLKTGEKGSIEAVVVDLSSENIETALNGISKSTGSQIGSSDTYVTTKSAIDERDYVSNLALVAKRIGTDDVIAVWFKKALCTSGFEIDMKNKAVAGNKYTFEACADQSDENVDTLPIEIIIM